MLKVGDRGEYSRRADIPMRISALNYIMWGNYFLYIDN